MKPDQKYGWAKLRGALLSEAIRCVMRNVAFREEGGVRA